MIPDELRPILAKVGTMKTQRAEMDRAFGEERGERSKLVALLLSELAPVLPALASSLAPEWLSEVDGARQPNRGFKVDETPHAHLFLMSSGDFVIGQVGEGFKIGPDGVVKRASLDEVWAARFDLGRILRSIDAALDAQINGKGWSRVRQARRRIERFRAIRTLIESTDQ